MDALEESATPRRQPPRATLAPFVQFVRDGAVDDASPYVRLPDGQLELVIQRTPARTKVSVIGTRVAPLRQGISPTDYAITVRFKAAGAYPFFGVPMGALTDEIVPLEELWGARAHALHDALMASTSVSAQVQVMEHALADRLVMAAASEPPSAATVRRAVRLLASAPALPSVEQLAGELGASTRQLRRAFCAIVGVTPKAYLRIVRFQRVLRASRALPEPAWGALAAAHGYYDQAHLIADFKALAGETPSALHRARQAHARAP